MKKIFSLLVLFSTLVFSQKKEEAKAKVNEGIEYHDQGKYIEAIAKYDDALKLDKDNIIALTEKALSLESLQKYDDAIDLCKRVLKLYPDEDNRIAYLTYANALDHNQKPDAALKIYDEGIKKYPYFYQFFFNKGVTLYGLKEIEKANKEIETATKLNPNHAGSFHALALINISNRVSSILASSRYLILDNQTPRAKQNFDSIINLMQKGVTKKDEKNISVTIEEGLLKKTEQKSENNFSSLELVLSMSAALDYDEKNKNKTEVEKFSSKFTTLVGMMDEVKKDQKGYYWDFLAPYFIEMKKKELIEPFANIVFLSSQNKDAIDYFEKNQDKINEFYSWSDNYKWK